MGSNPGYLLKYFLLYQSRESSQNDKWSKVVNLREYSCHFVNCSSLTLYNFFSGLDKITWYNWTEVCLNKCRPPGFLTMIWIGSSLITASLNRALVHQLQNARGPFFNKFINGLGNKTTSSWKWEFLGYDLLTTFSRKLHT